MRPFSFFAYFWLTCIFCMSVYKPQLNKLLFSSNVLGFFVSFLLTYIKQKATNIKYSESMGVIDTKHLKCRQRTFETVIPLTGSLFEFKKDLNKWTPLPADLRGKLQEKLNKGKIKMMKLSNLNYDVRIVPVNSNNLRIIAFILQIFLKCELNVEISFFIKVISLIYFLVVVKYEIIKFKMDYDLDPIPNFIYKSLFPPCDFKREKFYCLSECFFYCKYIPQQHKSNIKVLESEGYFTEFINAIKRCLDPEMDDIVNSEKTDKLLRESVSKLNEMFSGKIDISIENENICKNIDMEFYKNELMRELGKMENGYDFDSYFGNSLLKNDDYKTFIKSFKRLSKNNYHECFVKIRFLYKRFIKEYNSNLIAVYDNQHKCTTKINYNNINKLETIILYSCCPSIIVEDMTFNKCHYSMDMSYHEFNKKYFKREIYFWSGNRTSLQGEVMLVAFMKRMVENYYEKILYGHFYEKKEKQMILFVLSIVAAVHFQIKDEFIIIEKINDFIRSGSYYNNKSSTDFPNSRWKTFCIAVHNFFLHIGAEGFIGLSKSNCNHNRLFLLMKEAQKDFDDHISEKINDKSIVLKRNENNLQIKAKGVKSKEKISKIKIYNIALTTEKAGNIVFKYDRGSYNKMVIVKEIIPDEKIYCYDLNLNKDYSIFYNVFKECKKVIDDIPSISLTINDNKLSKKEMRSYRNKIVNVSLKIEPVPKNLNYIKNMLDFKTKAFPYDPVNDITPPIIGYSELNNVPYFLKGSLIYDKINFYKNYIPMGLMSAYIIRKQEHNAERYYNKKQVKKYKCHRMAKVINNKQLTYEIMLSILNYGYYFHKDRIASIINNIKLSFKGSEQKNRLFDKFLKKYVNYHLNKLK